MKQRYLLLTIILAFAAALTACGKDTSREGPTLQSALTGYIELPRLKASESISIPEPEVAPEGMCRSDLTNEWIDESLKDQRPIAAMIDNEIIALPHYGVSRADIVYEMMNSTMNGRITRFMVMVKDWDSIEQLGNIRSARTTNVILAAEWNAVLCHDGGPFYIDPYLKEKCSNHFVGSFTRIPNGKSREFTDYIAAGDIRGRFESNKMSTTYNEYYEGTHFRFAPEETPVALADSDMAAESIALPFPHNQSCLEYKPEDQLYYYSEYGESHLDPGNNNAQLCFKNLILQKCSFTLLDENGYMSYDCIGSGDGYFITNGKAVPVTWKKDAMASPTHFYDAQGNDITLNTGKTYIALVPADRWDELVVE